MVHKSLQAIGYLFFAMSMTSPILVPWLREVAGAGSAYSEFADADSWGASLAFAWYACLFFAVAPFVRWLERLKP